MLPPEITAKASLRGQEYAWPLDEFVSVLKKAAALEFACEGGQFQFRLPSGPTCEMYWHSVDPKARISDEPWADYVKRCEEEVRLGFERLIRDVDFEKEASGWNFTEEKKADPSFDPMRSLCFVAYFVRNPERANQSSQPTPGS